MAEGLASAGASVAIWGTNETKNAAAVYRLRALGAGAEAFICNVGEEAQVVEAFAATLQRFGRVDACFANAGVAGYGIRFDDMDLTEWRRVMEVNLDGAFLTFRAAVRHMLERGGGGSLVATSSLASVAGMARGQHYAATKAGLSAMVRSLAVEYGGHGIRANAILPGWIETAMTADWMERPNFRNAVLPRVPLGRWGTAEDFAGIAVYLASDASRYHSGDTIVVDGAYRVF
jgi:NAD(P)-dependent dehydrogenase (short-subunit alcohol dehydrogenase family)